MTTAVIIITDLPEPTPIYNFTAEQIRRMDADDWQDAADMSGPYMPLAELELFLDNASPDAQACDMYHFLDGVRFGRWMEMEEVIEVEEVQHEE